LKFISSAGNGIFVNASATVSLQTGLEFGACSSAHIAANAPGANIQLGSPYTVSGNASAHWQALGLSKLTANGSTVTFSGTITFSGPFAYASRLGYIDAEALTFVNSFTGQRYHADTNGVITTFTGNSNYFPGTIAGDVATGGVYN
jgi:hypothetical protein